MLSIQALKATVNDKEILHGINLQVLPGEVHAIMGPNGSGKSTLAYLLAGREGYEITSGTVLFEGESLLAMSTEERARRGLFLAMQYPVELPGVNNMNFLRESVNAIRRARAQPELDAVSFMQRVKETANLLNIDQKLLKRSVNADFSGGEKKHNEILQMLLLEPKLTILDEIDSGLDIDAMRIVAAGVNRMRSPERAMIVVTHYQRLLEYVEPDYVHVLIGGRILRSGGRELALELEQKGYGWVEAEAAP